MVAEDYLADFLVGSFIAVFRNIRPYLRGVDTRVLTVGIAGRDGYYFYNQCILTLVRSDRPDHFHVVGSTGSDDPGINVPDFPQLDGGIVRAGEDGVFLLGDDFVAVGHEFRDRFLLESGNASRGLGADWYSPKRGGLR